MACRMMGLGKGAMMAIHCRFKWGMMTDRRENGLISQLNGEQVSFAMGLGQDDDSSSWV